MATASQIINKAKSYVGVKENPPYSNNVIFNTDYYGHPVNGSAYSWCCTFVWDIFRMCGASDLFYGGQKTASCTTVLNWAKNNGMIVNNSSGRKGDLILFDWDSSGDADHIGFIVEKNSDGSYTTVEGNTSLNGSQSDGGEVMLRNRKSYIRAIVRPKYAPDTLKYRAYCQSYGWKDWQTSGEIAGTTGEGKRLEAVQFDAESKITAQAHCQSYGDMPSTACPNICGTCAESKRMEAIKLDAPYKIRYKAHIQGIGWTDFVTNGTWCGPKGEGKRLEAIIVETV